MKKIILIALSLTLISWIPSVGASECKSYGKRVLNYSASIDKKQSFSYLSNGPLPSGQKSGLTIKQCEKAGQKRKSLMIGFGPIKYGLMSDDLSLEYTSDIGKEECKIENSTFPVNSEETKKNLLLKHRKFLDICVERRVKHRSRYPLRFKDTQKECNIKRIGKQEAILSGNVCFFNIFPDSEFFFTHKIKQECTSEEFLAKNGLHAMSMSAIATINIVGNQSGETDDFELLDSKVVNFQVDPSKEKMSISDDWGLDIPQHPDVYKVDNLHIGKPVITALGEEDSTINLPFVVDRKCKRVCKNGKCESNSCDFSQPISGEVVLYQLGKNGKKEYLDSWFTGGIAPSNWQGFINNGTRNLNKISFKKGSRFLIDVMFKDPKFDFQMFNRDASPLIQLMPGLNSVNFAKAIGSGLPELDPVTGMPDFKEFGVFGDIGTNNDFNLNGKLPKLSKQSYWPPFYSKICHGKYEENCAKPSNKNFAKFQVYFTSGGTSEDTDEYILKDIRYVRNSEILENLNMKDFKFPKISCPWDLY